MTNAAGDSIPTEAPNGARRLRLALAQIDVTVGDLAGNVQRVLQAARQAYDAGANIACFPELCLPGYPPEDLLLKPGFVADNLHALDELTGETSDLPGMLLVVGFADRVVDLYNAAALLRDGRQVGTYHKAYLPNYGVFDEDRYFSAGTAAPTFTVDGVCIGPSICEDIWYPGGTPTEQAYAGAEVLINISASPFFVGKQAARERMLSTRAADVGAVVAYVNLVGGQDELIFDGSSVVFDGQGELIARARALEEDLLIVDLDIEEVFRTRLHDPRRRKERRLAAERAAPPVVVSAFPSRAARLGNPLSDGAASSPPREPGAPGRVEPSPDRLEEAYRALVLGVRDYVNKNRFTEAIIALSGGIDSALTATIAVDALGAQRVLGISMPSRYSSQHSKDDARQLAENLGIRYVTMPIEDIFAAALQTVGPVYAAQHPPASTLMEENLQARIRGNLLMALSNRPGAMVLTTGNKSEMAVGYATLYGDMAGGFAVLKDVFKTLVFELARWRNQQAGFALIPTSTLEKPPSAELRPGQKDTDSLPPYDLLDPILRAYVEEDRSYEAIVALGFDPATVWRVMAMVDRSEYKRRQAPPGVKITERAFGRDRRLPITNAYRGQPFAVDGAREQEVAETGDHHRPASPESERPAGAASTKRSR
jgi:NAD+ synthase (glutamine-hydrolysing)